MSTVSPPELHRLLSSSVTMQRLAAESHARDVITKDLLEVFLSEESATTTAEKLLTALEKKAAEGPRFTSVVLDILEKSGDFAFIAEHIKSKSTLQPMRVQRPPGPTVIARMEALRKSFSSLCVTLQDKIDNANADKCKSVVLKHLQNLPSNAQAHQMKEMNQKHSVDDILSTLINSGFCSYLDYKPLPAIIACYDDMEELRLQLRSYEEKHEAFCKETTLVELVQTFTDHPKLQPVVSVEIPFLVFQLSHPWPDLRLHTAITTLCSVLPSVSQLQLHVQAVEGCDQISMIVCGFHQSAFSSLVGDVKKPDTARILQELGINAKLSMESHPLVQQPAVVMTADCAVQTTDDDHLVHESQQEEEEQRQILELEENRRKLTTAQEARDQLMTQFNSVVTSLNHQLEEMREEHKADLKAKEEEIKLQQERSNEEITSFKQQVSSLQSELEEKRRMLTTFQEAKDQLMTQLSSDVASINHQLKEMRERHEAVLKDKEEEIKLLQEQLEKSRRVDAVAEEVHEAIREEKASTTPQRSPVQAVQATPFTYSTPLPMEERDQLMTQLSDGLASVSNQLKEIWEEHQAVLKAREEGITKVVSNTNSSVQTSPQEVADVGVQFNYLIPVAERLRGVTVAGEKLFLVSGEGPQLLEWEEYGFRMQVPEDATFGPCDIAVKAIVAGQFQFPEGTELVSAVYAISASRKLSNSVHLEIEHCVRIENEVHSEYLSFGIASCDQHTLPYIFEPLKDGTFSPKSLYGAVLRRSFSLIGVFKWLLGQPTTPSPNEAETGSTAKSSLASASPASLIHMAEDSDSAPDRSVPQVLQIDSAANRSLSVSETEHETAGLSTEEPESPVAHSDLLSGADEVEVDKAVNWSLSSSDLAKHDSKTEQLASDVPENQYSAQVFLEPRGERNFCWRFVVGKNLKAITTYTRESHPNWQEESYFKFRFLNDCLELQLEKEQDCNEWLIWPSDYPCKIRQRDVDVFWKDSKPPCCQVKVIAQDNASKHLHYAVPIKNVDSEKNIVFIQCSLTETNQSYQGAASKPLNTEKQGTSQANPLDRAPRISELLNKVAAKATNQWKIIGLQLDIQLHQLNSISTNQSNEICYAEVFDMWQKREDRPFTWATIIEALKAPIVKQERLAKELEEWLKTAI